MADAAHDAFARSTAYLSLRLCYLQRALPPMLVAIALQGVATAMDDSSLSIVALILDAVVALFLVRLLLRVDRPWRDLLRVQGLAVAEPVPAALVVPPLLFTVGIPLLLLAWPDPLAEKQALLFFGSVASLVLLLAAFAATRNVFPMLHAHRVLLDATTGNRSR